MRLSDGGDPNVNHIPHTVGVFSLQAAISAQVVNTSPQIPATMFSTHGGIRSEFHIGMLGGESTFPQRTWTWVLRPRSDQTDSPWFDVKMYMYF